MSVDGIKIGDKLEIHCYKHNGKLHRQWDEAVVLDIYDDYIVFGNNRTTVIDSDGKVWKTKEPAIMFFFKDRWFNIIGQLKDYGIYFYCNIATPVLIDNKVIKYIDYDLDLRVFPNGSFKILDRMEYKYHKKQMHYSNRLDFILKYELGNLIDMVRRNEMPFDRKTINDIIEYLTNSQIEELALKYDLRPGMGMAAIQLGIPKRYFVVVHEYEEKKFNTYVIINPKIVSTSTEKIYVTDGEGCLSVNRETVGITPRYARVTIEGYDMDGNKIRVRGREELAIAFQHEYDHLNGILFIDKIDKKNPFKDQDKMRGI